MNDDRSVSSCTSIMYIAVFVKLLSLTETFDFLGSINAPETYNVDEGNRDAKNERAGRS